MNRIKQLSSQEAQKIAAGEVVERPANIVKELVENSLDAGATVITIFVQDSGKSLIRVVDNGCGMNPEDARLCFAHHATSKITSIDDLQTLTTFGFRGEALSSISAVSKITVITKEQDLPHATQLTLEAGLVISQEQTSGNTGTDMSVADLFYNIPARKKFLKTNETEWRQILILFQAFCLAYPQVHFKLFSQGNLLFNCPGIPDLQQRSAQLWDHTIAQQLIPAQSITDTITIRGIISNHTYTRYDRSSMFFLVNNRWVKNHILAKAVLKGYQNVLPPDKFPLVCLAITIDPSQVDINIHPRKEEVQFLHPRILESILQTGVKTALEKNLSDQLKKPVTLRPAQPAFNQPAFPRRQSEPVFQFDGVPRSRIESIDSKQNSLIIPPTQQSHAEYRIIGQLYKTYILIEQEEHLMIIDQHAAHERILYELFSNRFKEVATIQLLFPAIISLTTEEFQILEPHLELFTTNNMAIEVFGESQVIIQAVPAYLKEAPLEELVRQTIGWIKEHQKLDADQLYKKVNEKLHAQMACKAAVKAGDILTQTQMIQLLTDLEKSPNRFTCPHGRPTGWDITKHEIEKKFKRKL